MENKVDVEDKALILAATSELDDYLSSSIIFWRLKGSTLPLTPGNLLLANLRVQNFQERNIEEAIRRNSDIIESRRSAWTRKIEAELPARLQQWKLIIDEIVDAGKPGPSYRYNARVRVILDLLVEELPKIDVKFEMQLNQMDIILAGIASEGGFIWNANLEHVFSRDKHEYLFIKMKGEEK